VGHVIQHHPLDPFYSEFLSHLGLHHFLGAVLDNTPEKISVISVQRTGKQGHVGNRQIALIGRLVPHFQRAQAMATRLKALGDSRDRLEHSLDWLTDGAALLRADGNIIYANDTLCALAQRGDGFRFVERSIEFATPDARRRFDVALGTVERLGDPSCDWRPTDFLVPRTDGMPAYIASVRPLVHRKALKTRHAATEIVLFVRDPLSRSAVASQILREMFSLTNAEAQLAQALCTGMTTGAYAIERQLSLNTVYSHLKRIREKTGCKSLPDLIRKFGEMNVPLRPN
jgi:DNA-binding CsgD family transcriptional regulator